MTNEILSKDYKETLKAVIEMIASGYSKSTAVTYIAKTQNLPRLDAEDVYEDAVVYAAHYFIKNN